MALHLTNGPVSTGGASGVPSGMLDNLALRCRPAGLFLLMLRPDGAVAYHDLAAGPFFQKFALPQLRHGDPSDPGALRDRVARCTADAAPAVWPIFPGLIAAAVPHVEKRQLAGVLLFVARQDRFALDEDVLRACSRLRIDGTWLNQQARELPGYGDEAMSRQAGLLLTMARDQARLASLEGEIGSLSGQLANTYEELSLIYQISGGMKVNRRTSDFFKQACLDVQDVMGVRGMGVALATENLSRQQPVIYGPMNLPAGAVQRLADALMPVLTRKKGPLLVNELSSDASFRWLAAHAERLLAVPLQRQEQVLGCLFALDKEDGEFDSVDSKLLNSIANESAIYLENAMLFEDVHGLMMGLLHSLTSAVDAKDAYTCGHSRRVAMLSRRLAVEAGLSESQAERIYMAGLLHDVGKIGVPESVLQKTGRLTPEEFDQMKKHPEIGARILQDIRQIRDLLPGVMHHHERYDGRGYPAGLAGGDIPLMGRIICLADCFDAMTSNRTYRKALPLEVALTEIRRCSGTQFDPQLAEAFLRVGADGFRELLDGPHEQAKLALFAPTASAAASASVLRGTASSPDGQLVAPVSVTPANVTPASVTPTAHAA